MPLSANSVVFPEMTILAKSGITFFEHEKKWCHSLCAFLLYSGTVCVHFYSFQALSVCISIISQHFLSCAFLLYSSTGCVHFYSHPALYACISIAFLLHFYCNPALFYVCIPALFYCISIAIQHFSSQRGTPLHYAMPSEVLCAFFLCAFLLCSNTVCM